jgi:hypothetical protein
MRGQTRYILNSGFKARVKRPLGRLRIRGKDGIHHLVYTLQTDTPCSEMLVVSAQSIFSLMIPV